jgi:hypothetical protein
MHNLIRIKKPIQVIFNYDPVLQNITMLGGIGMFFNNGVIVITLTDNLLDFPHEGSYPEHFPLSAACLMSED